MLGNGPHMQITSDDDNGYQNPLPRPPCIKTKDYPYKSFALSKNGRVMVCRFLKQRQTWELCNNMVGYVLQIR